MKRFKNILLVHERGNRGRKALGRAVDLAARNEARLTLVEVIEPPSGRGRRVKTTAGEMDVLEVVARDRMQALEDLAASLDLPGSQVETKVLRGTPFPAIIREVELRSHDLVLLTTEGGGMREHLFGSTSRHLIRKCPCPVWVVRPARRKRSIRVLAAVNPAEEHPSGRDLDRRILELGSSLAAMYEGHLHVVHAWQAVPRSTRVTSRALASWNAEIMTEAETRLRELMDSVDLPGPTPHLHLPGGPVGLKIAETAAELHCDIVIIGTLSRSGLKGLLIGNTAESVLQYVDASVLAVKPQGFVSPLAESVDTP